MIRHGLTLDGKNKFGLQLKDNKIEDLIGIQVLINLNETNPPKVRVNVDDFVIILSIFRPNQEPYKVELNHCNGDYLVKYNDGLFGLESKSTFLNIPHGDDSQPNENYEKYIDLTSVDDILKKIDKGEWK